MAYSILTVNPGSTSTKVAVFRGEEEVWNETLRHPADDLAAFGSVTEQFGFRLGTIRTLVEKYGGGKFDAVVGRGGVIDPLPGGTFHVDRLLVERLKLGKPWEHASNLGGILAEALASEWDVPAFIVDPVCVDEMVPEAKITGLPELPKSSFSHALNTKATVRRAAREMGRAWDDLCCIVVHLGGGVSISAHRRGRIADTNNVNECGPFSPERAGGAPVGALARLCFSGRCGEKEIRRKIAGMGGLRAHLGTSDMREVLKIMAEGGEKGEKAALLYRAMAWHIAKEVGAQAVSMGEKTDAILFTGGIAYDSGFVRLIQERVQWIAPCLVYPGEDEMLALAQGALRVLSGEEEAKRYGDYALKDC
ncbi:MAG: butyrate kinase [Synergistaceae bacterium]|jgi:butyrate kinase|nr:butyrate kinase [Synergistaceae bacterium]